MRRHGSIRPRPYTDGTILEETGTEAASMTILDHVHRVLALAGEPLHYREITSRILTDRWTTTGGKPWESVSARLAVDVKRGSGSRFGRTSPGMFGLNRDFDTASSTDQALAPPAPEPPLVRSNDIMSSTDAAEHILREPGGREPMHYARIAELAIARRMIRTVGSTPAATMYSVILQERRRRDAHGEPQRFVQHGRGLVGWPHGCRAGSRRASRSTTRMFEAPCSIGFAADPQQPLRKS